MPKEGGPTPNGKSLNFFPFLEHLSKYNCNGSKERPRNQVQVLVVTLGPSPHTALLAYRNLVARQVPRLTCLQVEVGWGPRLVGCITSSGLYCKLVADFEHKRTSL